jgi:hypothetical protein
MRTIKTISKARTTNTNVVGFNTSRLMIVLMNNFNTLTKRTRNEILYRTIYYGESYSVIEPKKMILTDIKIICDVKKVTKRFSTFLSMVLFIDTSKTIKLN